jgi:hypothetical protein
MKAKRIPTANDGFLGYCYWCSKLVKYEFPEGPGRATTEWAKSHKTLKKFGDPGWIRTSDPQLRRLVLYPAELRGLAWRRFTRAVGLLKGARWVLRG